MSLRSNTGRRGCFVQYIEDGMADLGQRKECLVPTDGQRGASECLRADEKVRQDLQLAEQV